jgi:hypothetical protein
MEFFSARPRSAQQTFERGGLRGEHAAQMREEPAAGFRRVAAVGRTDERAAVERLRVL